MTSRLRLACISVLRRAMVVGIIIPALLVAALASPAITTAQGDNRTAPPTWADAPRVPRHRSEADWLVDAGWKTFDEVYGSVPAQDYQPGGSDLLVPLGGHTPQPFDLALRTPHAYFWFEQGWTVDWAALDATAEFFETHIFPLSRRLFGTADSPGLDDEPIHIVNQTFIGPGILGAFNPQDDCPQSLCPQSNQRAIIYLSLDNAPLNSREYLTTLAHEHQHLIQHHLDGNEQRWFNEGLSQLVEYLNGFAPDVVAEVGIADFLRQPDHHLTGWARLADQSSYYGAGYLFMVYLFERFGLDFMQQLATSDYDGLAAVQNTLLATGQAKTVDSVFAEWIIANYLDDPYVASGQYYYQGLNLPVQIQAERLALRQDEHLRTDTLNQYGADYLLLDTPGAYRLSFDGSDTAPILDTTPPSGQWMWWSYNLASSTARLTASFDLTGLDSATLEFSAWWLTEMDNDWLHVLASDNGGQSWHILSGPHAIQRGPQAPGAYYSGYSQGWIEEQIDLSAFAGAPVLIRFEYVTDGSITGQGVGLDDLRIPELGVQDAVENVLSRWQPEGFLRTTATVAQQWTLALVRVDGQGIPSVQPIALDALNTGRAEFEVEEGGSAVLVIGAMAPFTETPGHYKVSVQRTE